MSTGLTVTATEARVTFKQTDALHASFTIPAGSIAALVGPNGSGKSTFAAALGARRALSSGSLTVDGHETFNNESVGSRISVTSEAGEFLADERLRKSLSVHRSLRPTWDEDLCTHLLQRFEVDPKQKPAKMSRGQRSAIGIVIGLSSGCGVTMFDEVTVGMDAEKREIFAEELLAAYERDGRTFIIATHLIDEVDHLADHLVVLKQGHCVYAGDADTLRGSVVALTGPADDVVEAAQGARVLRTTPLGAMSRATVACPDAAAAQTMKHDATRRGLGVEQLGLQAAVVRLTGKDTDAPHQESSR